MKYTFESALRKAERGGAKIAGGVITASGLGIGTWGAVDYLVKVHNYKLRIVN